MRKRKFLLAITMVMFGPLSLGAQTPAEIEGVVNTMVRLCVLGGRTEVVSGGGTGGAELSLRSLDAKGNINGEFKINKSSAEGLVEGLNGAMTSITADQADKVRVCLQPVRERLLDLMLPKKSSSSSPIDPCAGANQQWQLAESIHTMPAYEYYLELYPRCMWGGLAKTRIQQIKSGAELQQCADKTVVDQKDAYADRCIGHD